MGISYVKSPTRNPGVDHAGNRGLSLIAWLGAMIAEVRRETALDDLGEGQLEDIGIRRLAQRGRWIDGLETSLPFDFEYSTTPHSPAAAEGHKQLLKPIATD